MRELVHGLWDWQGRHPEWEEGQPWGPVVSSHALDDGQHLLLFDPLDVPDEIRELARSRRTAIVLTAPWHERDTEQLVEELSVQEIGVPVYAARPDTPQDLIHTFGVSAERVEGFVSDDLRWLVEGGGEYHVVTAEDPPPFGIEVFTGRTHNDLVFWIDRFRIIVSGDSLADWGTGLAIQPEWLTASVDRDELVRRLRPLLDRPVEIVLPAHGSPTDRAALEQALA